MLKKLAELRVNKNAHYYNTIIIALEKDGFTVIEEVDTSFETHYIIAKECKDG